MMILETHNLSIGYQQTALATSLRLSLRAGEMVCLMGPNGAGKSTLLRTLAGVQPPLAGKICLMGDDLHQLRPADLAQRLSLVLTDRPNVGLLTGYELVALGRHPYTDWTGRLGAPDEIIIRRAVEAVGAQHIAARPVHELSDGQRQKIMIARALAQEPALLILDEPTAFLDIPRRVEIMRLLRLVTRQTGRTVLLATHDLDLALHTADRIWLLDETGHVHSGAPEDLVLAGAFETAFQSEGVTFDPLTGSFRIAAETCVGVKLVGEGIATLWTQRALERAGYAVTASAPLTIHVLDDAGRARWQMDAEQFTSLEGLLAALNSADIPAKVPASQHSR